MIKKLTRSTFKRKIYNSEIIEIEGLSIQIDYKKINRIYLKISSRDASIKICAPLKTNSPIIRNFVNQKLSWIHQNRQKILQKNLSNSNLQGKIIRYLGKNYHLELKSDSTKPRVEIEFDQFKNSYEELVGSIFLINCDKCDELNKNKILEKFFRDKLSEIAFQFLEKWQKIAQVKVEFLGIKKMRTRYGSCNPRHKRIWLSLSLIHYKIDFIEYVIVHEIAHFFVQNHGQKFYAKMDELLPNWRSIKNLKID
ncbi:MAG: DUF45 domain-containing protein [Proteobacteria bacterium]|nr:DUF45 domain-containing protein [Pseudomonadota bacterium]